MRLRCLDDRGSIPLVLLTSIIVAGLILVLVAAVIVNQRTARFDRSFTTVLQDSDEYVQEAANNLIRANWDATRADAVGTTTNPTTGKYAIAGATSCPADDDGEVCLTATKTSALRYEVEATAAERTTGDEIATRTVSAEVVDLPRFFLAAFADTGIDLKGGNNKAASYGSGLWYTDHGIVASNEEVGLNGMSTAVDGVHLYNFDAWPDVDRCDDTGGTGCDDIHDVPITPPSATVGPKLQVGDNRLGTGFIDDALAGCGALTSYTSSTNGSTLSKGTFPRCVDNLTFDTDITIVDGPIEVYVAGKVSVEKKGTSRTINCPAGGCIPGGTDPDSTALRIYSDGGDIAIDNGVDIAAAIYAPESTCGGNPSAAQARIFGSMICKDITSNGGWSFYYDDDLFSVGSGVWALENYREE